MVRPVRFAFPLLAALAILGLGNTPAGAQAADDVAFHQRPPEILKLVDVEFPPRTLVDPASRHLVFLQQPVFKTLEELARPELRLAGLRINPKNHDQSRSRYFTRLSVMAIASGKAIPVTGLPAQLRIEYPSFSPRGRYLAFAQAEADCLSLWVVELASGKARQLTRGDLSAAMGTPFRWAPNEQSLYVRVRLASEAPAGMVELPKGPVVQESTGRKAPGYTYQDLLKNQADERRFEYYARAEIRRIPLEGDAHPVLPAGIYPSLELSPDGAWLLVREIRPPYSYQFPLDRFPSRLFLTDRNGREVKTLSEKPLLDQIPIANDACEPGPRDATWRDDLPSTVVWTEALDGGDPAKEAEYRDRLVTLDAPFTGAPQTLCETKSRLVNVTWGDASLAVVQEYWWKTRSVRVSAIDPAAPAKAPRKLFEYSSEDLYHLPGDFSTEINRYGRDTLQFGEGRSCLYLEGEGYSPEGNRPFLDRYDLATSATRRLWRADGKETYEAIVRLLDPSKKTLLTRIESPTRFPNLYLRTYGGSRPPRALTSFANPYVSFTGIAKQKIHYRRADGVDLSADLYLPKGYAPAQGRLPVLIDAYPTEFKDSQAAGMVDSSPHQFVFLFWGSPVFWAARGYAVLENAQFPIVGHGKEEPNDTYIEQLVADGRAAIEALDRMGVGDPKRVAVMGHSYGAFMVANLMTHSDLFAAGVARSGAYNRSLTPFGFQSEERSYWEAQAVYQKMSPFNYADKLAGALLLIHGDADNNPGTFTLQSERLFQAVKGLGGKARLVLLPFESHGYQARENILHLLWEEDCWLEQHVKNGSK